MSTGTQKVVLRSLAAISLGLAAPVPLLGQLVSARPATVGLTVVVPPKAPATGTLTSEGVVSLISATPTAIDVETRVGLTSRKPARVEVRLGDGPPAESSRIWIRNARGEFERLQRDASVVAIDGPLETTETHPALRFRVESNDRLAVTSLAIPVEYRLTVGNGDQFSVWSFPSVLRVDAGR